MGGENQTPLQESGNVSERSQRETLRDAVRYWELRRIWYNAVLTAVVVAWVAISWPHFRAAMAPGALVYLLVFAALANLCYCAAYIVDLPIQYSEFQAVWRRRRWGLWLAGMLLAFVIGNYWIADEIYPYVG